MGIYTCRAQTTKRGDSFLQPKAFVMGYYIAIELQFFFLAHFHFFFDRDVHLLRFDYTYLAEQNSNNKAFRHVETIFVQGNQVRTDQNKPTFLLTKRWLFY